MDEHLNATHSQVGLEPFWIVMDHDHALLDGKYYTESAANIAAQRLAERYADCEFFVLKVVSSAHRPSKPAPPVIWRYVG